MVCITVFYNTLLIIFRANSIVHEDLHECYSRLVIIVSVEDSHHNFLADN